MPEIENTGYYAHNDDYERAVHRIVRRGNDDQTIDMQVEYEYQLFLKMNSDPRYNADIGFQNRLHAMGRQMSTLYGTGSKVTRGGIMI